MYICAGQVSIHQQTTPKIFHSNGALINPHVVPQLTHFAPIQCVAPAAIKDCDKLDACCIVVNPDPEDLVSRSFEGHVRDLST